MTQYDLLETIAPILAKMDKNGILASDVHHLEMFREWQRLKGEGHKVRYIAAYLSEQYNCGVSNVYRIVKRMNRLLV